MYKMDVKELEGRCRAIRRNIVRMVSRAEGGHLGSPLSIVEILVALYFGESALTSTENDRNHIVLSKGHGCAALYATLVERGLLDASQLGSFLSMNGVLPGHPDKNLLPLIDANTGSLGNGLSIGVGLALGKRLLNRKGRIFVVLGDGEMNEGMVWEALMCGAQFGLNNLIAIVDRNGRLIASPTEKIMALEPLRAKVESFGWRVLEADGHDVGALAEIFGCAVDVRRPTLIIASTTKGKGICFMEDQPDWHYNKLSPPQLERALQELTPL